MPLNSSRGRPGAGHPRVKGRRGSRGRGGPSGGEASSRPSPPLFSFASKQQWQLATAGFEPVWALCVGRLGSGYNSGDTGDQHRVPAPSGRAGNSGAGACGPWKSLDPPVGLARTKVRAGRRVSGRGS